MTTTLTITSGQTSFTAQGYTILPSPGTAVPDNLAQAILSAANTAGVVLSSSAGTGIITVPSRRFNRSGVGPPVAGEGSWLLGDEIVDSAGTEYECSAPGNPGTWTTAQSGTFVQRLSASGDTTGVNDLAAVNAALSSSAKTVILFGGTFRVNGSVQIPSGKTLILWDATLFLVAGSNVPVVMNANPVNSGTSDSQVSLIGYGRALIDHNPANQSNTLQSWQSVSVLFVGVAGLRIQGIQISMRFNAIQTENCTGQRISRINFEGAGATTNQGGLSVCGGSDIEFDNLTGTTNDDFVGLFTFTTKNALTCFWVGAHSGVTTNVDDVRGSNISCATQTNVLRILNGDGKSITNVTIDGLYNSNKINASSVVQFGQSSYVTTIPTASQCSGITLSNLYGGDNSGAVVLFNQSCQHVRINGITVPFGYAYDKVIGSTYAGTQSIINLKVTDVAVQSSSSGDLIAFGSGVTVTEMTVSGVQGILNNILNNAATITMAEVRNLNLATLKVAISSSTVNEDLLIDGLQWNSYIGTGLLKTNSPTRFGPGNKFTLTSASVSPAATSMSWVRCDSTKVLDGGAASPALYVGDGTSWNRLLTLAH